MQSVNGNGDEKVTAGDVQKAKETYEQLCAREDAMFEKGLTGPSFWLTCEYVGIARMQYTKLKAEFESQGD